MLFTSPTNSGLITGLFVVFAPLADRLFFGLRSSRLVLVAVALSVLGMVLLAGGGPDGVNLGDLLTLLCAAALGLHIALLSRYAAGYDASGLAFAQMLSVAVVFGVFWPFFEPVAFPPREVWLALVATGLVASAGAFWVQTFVQQRIPAARTAVILTMEPVFAALFGYWLAGDRLIALQVFGAALILSALLVCEVLPVLPIKRSGKKVEKSTKERRPAVMRSVEVPEYEVHGEVRVDPARTALVVVDMQNDFVKEGGSLVVPDAEATIPIIKALLDLARESGMKVIFTQDTHNEGDPEWEIWPEHVWEGSWGWEIVNELEPREDELVIRKVRYDAFYGTHLDHFLRLWRVDNLIICGTVANICVHYTAASAALRWFDVVIPKDATSALDPFDLESSLRQTSFLFNGKITQSAAIKATV